MGAHKALGLSNCIECGQVRGGMRAATVACVWRLGGWNSLFHTTTRVCADFFPAVLLGLPGGRHHRAL